MNEPCRQFETGEEIPFWSDRGDLLDYATVVFCSGQTLILELPDSVEGRVMFRLLARDQEVSELERLYKL